MDSLEVADVIGQQYAIQRSDEFHAALPRRLTVFRVTFSIGATSIWPCE
jgi:hypothetical protein